MLADRRRVPQSRHPSHSGVDAFCESDAHRTPPSTPPPPEFLLRPPPELASVDAVPARGDRRSCRRRGPGPCGRVLLAVCSPAGVCLVLLGYIFLGAYLYMISEGEHESRRRREMSAARRETVERLWEITVSLNVLYKDNWTRLVSWEMEEFQRSVAEALGGADSRDPDGASRWDFSGCFLYAVTVISTIGFGNRTPRTIMGKVVTIVYASFGIPLVFLYLSNVGNMLAKNLQTVYFRVLCCRGRQPSGGAQKEQFLSTISVKDKDRNVCENHVASGRRESYLNSCKSDALHTAAKVDSRLNDEERTKVPVLVCFLILMLYLCGGAALFSSWENWNFFESVFFCFVSLSTIGFGEMFPGSGLDSNLEVQIAFVFCAIYLLTGMALFAMCVSLIQDNYSGKCSGFQPNRCFEMKSCKRRNVTIDPG